MKKSQAEKAEMKKAGTERKTKKFKRDLKWIEKNREPRDKEVDKALWESFQERRKKNKQINWKWMRKEIKAVYQRVHGEVKPCKVGGSSVSKFLVRMRRRTNKKNRSVEDRLTEIQDYHRNILSLRNSIRKDRPDQPRDSEGGRFAWSDTYSFDEHAIELLRNKNQTYEVIGTERVQIAQPKGSLDQRQCSALLTFRAVGPQNVPPVLVFPLQPYKIRDSNREVIDVDPFRGSNVVTEEERKQYDPRVAVVYDPSMVANVTVMKAWTTHFASHVGVETEKLLSMDNFYSHIDYEVQTGLRETNTLISYVPPNCTDIIQVNDRCLGKLFKDTMSELIDAHIDSNWETWYEGGVSASARRILLTKFAGAAWQELCQKQELITQTFASCGLLLKPDYYNINDVKIRGYDGFYSVIFPIPPASDDIEEQEFSFLD